MSTELRIITDSAVQLDEAFLREHHIEVMPMIIDINGKRYREGIDITAEEYFQIVETTNVMPNLVAPPPREWARLYQAAAREAPNVLVLTHSARLSQAYEHAREAVNYVFGKARFWVIDTQTIGYGQGIIVRQAVLRSQENTSAPDVVRFVRAIIPHVYAQFLTDRLDYLEKYRRVGPAQALLGTMLGVKPLVLIEDGTFIPIEKVREWQDGVEKLHDFVIEFLHIEEIAILQHNMEDETALLLERLEMTLGQREFPVYGYQPSLAVHLGPKALGVVVYEGVDAATRGEG